MRNLLAAALVFVATPVLAHGEPVSPGSKCHHNPPTMRAKGTHCFHPASMLSPEEKLERRCNSLRTYLKNPIHAKAARRDMAKLGCPASSSGLRDGAMRPTPAAASRTAKQTPVEPEAVLGSTIKELPNRQEVLDELVRMIRARGWRCNTISSARMMVFSRGFEMTCNGFAYEYEIRDRGGRWVVTLE